MKINIPAYRQLWRLLMGHPRSFVCLCTTSLFSVLCEGLGLGLVLPLLSNTAIDVDLFSQIPLLAPLDDFASNLTLSHRVYLAAFVLITITFVRSAFSYISQLLATLLKTKIERRLQAQIFRQLHDVELRFIHGKRLADMLTILSHHTYQIGRLVLHVGNTIVNLFTIIVYIILMMLISWQLTLAATGLLLGVSAVIRKKLSIRIKQSGADIAGNIKRLRAIGVESLSAMKLIHLFSLEERSITHFGEALQVYHSHYYQAGKLIALTKPLFHVLNAVFLGLLLIASTFLLPGQAESWLGQMALFLIIAFRLMRPATSLAQVQALIAQQHPILQSVLEFLHQEDKPYLQNGHIRFETLTNGIKLEHVTFRYDAQEANVLHDVSFEIPKGKMTAVVGASGAGKSTLVDLIARLYDCEDGQITVDGVDLRDLDIESWRSCIAVVSQDTFILNNTVQANLELAKETATEDEVYEAARTAQAHDFIMALPQGYDTVLGDRGVRLSGGQKQRVAIARAILVDPQFLILDEATSELDSETELAIQAAITQYGQGRTILVVAHRLSTIRHADNIVVLSSGRVVEQGTHKELMQARRNYWQLVKAQNLEAE